MNRVQTMLVSELAERADVPLATVKYYLREGLLPPGENVGPRGADYGEAHLRRLRVLRALRDVRRPQPAAPRRGSAPGPGARRVRRRRDRRHGLDRHPPRRRRARPAG